MDPSPYAAPDTARLLTLFASHVRQHGWQAPGAASFDAFVAQPGLAVLVFSDDPRRVPECWDVAVILPDLAKLEEKYKKELVVIGVHSGKYATEHDDDSIRDAPFNPLGGPGYLNGNFSTGESYDVRNRWVYLPLLRH